MIQKTLFLCVCFIIVAPLFVFLQPVPLVLTEDETSELSISAFSALYSAPSGKGGVSPLSVTEYQGAALNSLVRAKTLIYKDGKAYSETVFAPDGSILHTVSYSYTDAGNIAEIRGADSAGALKWAYRYEYDEQNRTVRETSVSVQEGNERTEGAEVLTYNEERLLLKKETFSAEGAVTLTESFSYDESGRLAEKNSYYGDGTLLKRIVHEYANEENRNSSIPENAVLRVRQYDSNGLYETSIFDYREGRLYSILRYGADSILKDCEIFYYLDGKVSRRVRFNAEGASVSETLKLYDWAGNRVMKRDLAGITIWEYTYPQQSFDGAL